MCFSDMMLPMALPVWQLSSQVEDIVKTTKFASPARWAFAQCENLVANGNFTARFLYQWGMCSSSQKQGIASLIYCASHVTWNVLPHITLCLWRPVPSNLQCLVRTGRMSQKHAFKMSKGCCHKRVSNSFHLRCGYFSLHMSVVGLLRKDMTHDSKFPHPDSRQHGCCWITKSQNWVVHRWLILRRKNTGYICDNKINAKWRNDHRILLDYFSNLHKIQWTLLL